MSRRTRSNSTVALNQNQAVDQDALMGPPPVPGSSSLTAPAGGTGQFIIHNVGAQSDANAAQAKGKLSKDEKEKEETAEKYQKLKRKYHELEEKYNEMSLELQRSGERNIKFREERNALIDRTIQLEAELGIHAGDSAYQDKEPFGPHPPSSAYSSKFLSDRARQAFEANMQEAAAEAQTDDLFADPTLSSNHVGPAARKRAEQERKDRQEEEVKETKKITRKAKGKAKEAFSSSTNATASVDHDTPVVTSSAGMRLRIRLPAPVEDNYDQESHPPSPRTPMTLDLQSREDAPVPGVVPSFQNANAPPSQPDSTTLPPSHSFREAPPKPDPNIDPALMAIDDPDPEATKQDHPNGFEGASTSSAAPQNENTTAVPSTSPSFQSNSLPSMIDTFNSVVSSTTPVGTPNSTSNMFSRASVPPSTPYMVSAGFPYAHLSPGGSAAGGSPLLAPVYSPTLGYMSPLQGPIPMSPHLSQTPSRQQTPQHKKSSPDQSQPKPKRQKVHTVVTKTYNIPVVPRGKDGQPMLPLNVGIMTVISLGKVCIRDHFHTERYIFPVGYEVTRRYSSTIDPKSEVIYHCTILDGGDGPKFQIIPSDVPDRPIIAGTATGAWSGIVKAANAVRNRQHSNSVSGPDFFGLGQNTIKHLIQQLPNADKLRDYVWQNFVEGGPLGGRHAAVIPALPEEYDTHLPIGAYYPSPTEREKTGKSSPDNRSHYPEHSRYQSPGLQALQTRHKQRQNSQSPNPGRSLGGSQSPTPSLNGGNFGGRSPSVQSDVSMISGDNAFNGINIANPVNMVALGGGNAAAAAVAAALSTATGVPPTFASIMNAYPAPAAFVADQAVS